jgi:hypothetical protein
MANNLTSNPIFIDTASGSTITNKKVQLIQWINEAADLEDTEDLVFTINGIQISMKYNLGSDVGQQDIIIYQAGPFADPIFVTSLTVDTIDDGALLIWCK